MEDLAQQQQQQRQFTETFTFANGHFRRDCDPASCEGTHDHTQQCQEGGGTKPAAIGDRSGSDIGDKSSKVPSFQFSVGLPGESVEDKDLWKTATDFIDGTTAKSLLGEVRYWMPLDDTNRIPSHITTSLFTSLPA